MSAAVAAVDLGATSGRVIVGHVGRSSLQLRAAGRFPNTPVVTPDGMQWNILELYRNVLEGLRAALGDGADVRSIGVDSWAVDYALLRSSRLLGTPYHYRDDRSQRGVEDVADRIDGAALYQRNGLQFLPFNTVYQLAAERDLLPLADSLLLIPDLMTYWLTGEQSCEVTNASTTGLLDVRRLTWDTELMDLLQIPTSLFRPLVSPGTRAGQLRETVSGALGVRPIAVTAVGSHDTASAVVGVPMLTDDAAYISCGTWGLVGVELEKPVLTERSRLANFSNEAGVDGRVRYLHNVMGLWLLNESVRYWRSRGEDVELAALLEQAAEVRVVAEFDTNDPRFLPPGDMPGRIADYCSERGLPAPGSPPEFVRCIIESMAAAFAAAIQQAADLSGHAVTVVHLVGGGSQNDLLCQLTADRTGLPLIAGPVEATAIGNILVQARAEGIVSGDLESLRSLVARTHTLQHYEPHPRQGDDR